MKAKMQKEQWLWLDGMVYAVSLKWYYHKMHGVWGVDGLKTL